MDKNNRLWKNFILYIKIVYSMGQLYAQSCDFSYQICFFLMPKSIFLIFFFLAAPTEFLMDLNIFYKDIICNLLAC